MNAETIDTNIPSAAFGMIFQVTRTIGRDPDVPICRECNRLSADVAFRTPEQKRRHIRRGLLSRHGSHLNVGLARIKWRDFLLTFESTGEPYE